VLEDVKELANETDIDVLKQMASDFNTEAERSGQDGRLYDLYQIQKAITFLAESCKREMENDFIRREAKLAKQGLGWEEK